MREGFTEHSTPGPDAAHDASGGRGHHITAGVGAFHLDEPVSETLNMKPLLVGFISPEHFLLFKSKWPPCKRSVEYMCALSCKYTWKMQFLVQCDLKIKIINTNTDQK